MIYKISFTKYTIIIPTIIKIIACVGSDSHIFISPRLICALKKRNNYKYDNTNYNYLSISNLYKRNTLFSNTNNKNSKISLNKLSQKQVKSNSQRKACDFVCVWSKIKSLNTFDFENIKNIAKNNFSLYIIYIGKNHINKIKYLTLDFLCGFFNNNNNKLSHKYNIVPYLYLTCTLLFVVEVMKNE